MLEASRQRSALRREGLRRALWYHRSKPCSMCGARLRPVAMDFHHRDPSKKRFTIGEACSLGGVGLSDAIEEIGKCDVVCVNCHRVMHGGAGDSRPSDLAWRARVEAALLPFKSRPCVDCGSTFDPVAMDFHHRRGEGKRREVAQWRAHGPRGDDGIASMLREVAKCDVVCAACHRIRHLSQQSHPKP